MKKVFRIAVFTVLVAAAAIFGTLYFQQGKQLSEQATQLGTVQEQLSEARKFLFGFNKYTDYIIAGKKAMEGQQKFLAAKIDREYTVVEHVQKSVLGFRSDGNFLVKYTVEYSVGFDLRSDGFSIAGDSDRITITLPKPGLVASPSVNNLSHEILGKGLITDEKSAVIALQQRLLSMAQKHAEEIIKEPAVIALSEKMLGTFLRDFLAKQPGVKLVPAIMFAYK